MTYHMYIMYIRDQYIERAISHSLNKDLMHHMSVHTASYTAALFGSFVVVAYALHQPLICYAHELLFVYTVYHV
jgi:hypothetical protein